MPAVRGIVSGNAVSGRLDPPVTACRPIYGIPPPAVPTPCRLSGDGRNRFGSDDTRAHGGLFALGPGVARVAFPSWRRSALPSVVTALVAVDAGPPEVRDENGMKPLHYTAVYGETLSVIAVLPEVGADPETLDEDG